jgi:DNA-binding GntR family transcriptional regulator
MQGTPSAEESASVTQIVRRPLAEEIRSRLRDEILAGRYEPGQRVTELEIAREMGTSQGPVREAFASLGQEGLLISLPHRGTFVATVSEAEARMAYAIRARIEPYAFELAIPKITPEVLRNLRTEIDQMAAAADHRDLLAHMAADMRFHGRIYEVAGTEVLAAAWGLIESTIRKFIMIAAPLYVADLHGVSEEHVALIRFLEAGDLEALRAAVPEHLADLWKRMRLAEPDEQEGHQP